MKAVRKHMQEKWIPLYIERWLTAPMLQVNGTLVAKSQGTPQGGVVSPVLSNLFLHYVFDKWMQQNNPEVPWCRYADDGLLHCKSLQQKEFTFLGYTFRSRTCKTCLGDEEI
jgi:RNA-directed DNA polymerase